MYFRLLLAAAASLSVSAALAQPTDTTPSPAQIAAASPAERLNLLASTARIGALTGDMRVFARLSTRPSDPGAPFSALSAADQRLLGFVVGQSIQFTAVNGRRGVTAWFNPLEDVWLVGLWAPFEDGWRLTALGVATSAELSSSTAPWLRGGPTLASALRAQGDRGRALFRDVIAPGRADALISDPAHTRTALAQVTAEARFQVDRLAATARLEGYTAYPQALETTLVFATGQVVREEAVRDRLLALPTRARTTLQPAMSFSRRDGQTFAVVSPYAPSLVFIVHFVSPQPGAAAQPVRIETVDLFSGAA